MDSSGLNLQILAEPRGGFPIPGVGASTIYPADNIDYVMDDCVMDTGIL